MCRLQAALSLAMVSCLVAMLLVVTVDACASKTSSAPPPGEPLTKAKLNTIARKIGGDFGEHLSWMANSSVLFTFNGKDDLPLQGYYLPNAEDKAAAQKKGKGATNPVIVYCAGWSETSLKYAKFLRVLNNMGYSIFSFDLRGQGFSSPTGYDKVRALPCHVMGGGPARLRKRWPLSDPVCTKSTARWPLSVPGLIQPCNVLHPPTPTS